MLSPTQWSCLQNLLGWFLCFVKVGSFIPFRDRTIKRSSKFAQNRPKMKLLTQIACAIGEIIWEWKWKFRFNLSPLLALLTLLSEVSAQRPSCWKAIQEDPAKINNVYFPHEDNCEFYYQCTMHGVRRMTCGRGQHFDVLTNQCGRPEEVDCDAEPPIARSLKVDEDKDEEEADEWREIVNNFI